MILSVALQLIYLIFAKLLSLLVLRARSNAAKEIETDRDLEGRSRSAQDSVNRSRPGPLARRQRTPPRRTRPRPLLRGCVAGVFGFLRSGYRVSGTQKAPPSAPERAGRGHEQLAVLRRPGRTRPPCRTSRRSAASPPATPRPASGARPRAGRRRPSMGFVVHLAGGVLSRLKDLHPRVSSLEPAPLFPSRYEGHLRAGLTGGRAGDSEWRARQHPCAHPPGSRSGTARSGSGMRRLREAEIWNAEDNRHALADGSSARQGSEWRSARRRARLPAR
jgi:hypothetical protein